MKNRPKIFLEYWPFGYRKAHAPVAAMLHFLEFVYDSIFVIDGHERELLPFDRTRFSDTDNTWSNLLFI